jgi:hypothetical protein
MEGSAISLEYSIILPHLFFGRGQGREAVEGLRRGGPRGTILEDETLDPGSATWPNWRLDS